MANTARGVARLERHLERTGLSILSFPELVLPYGATGMMRTTAIWCGPDGPRRPAAGCRFRPSAERGLPAAGTWWLLWGLPSARQSLSRRRIRHRVHAGGIHYPQESGDRATGQRLQGHSASDGPLCLLEGIRDEASARAHCRRRDLGQFLRCVPRPKSVVANPSEDAGSGSASKRTRRSRSGSPTVPTPVCRPGRRPVSRRRASVPTASRCWRVRRQGHRADQLSASGRTGVDPERLGEVTIPHFMVEWAIRRLPAAGGRWRTSDASCR